MPMILLLSIVASSWAIIPKPFKYELRHPRTALVLEWDGRMLKATDRTMKTSILLKKCNEKLLSEFFGVDEVMFRDRPASNATAVKVLRGSESFSASSESRLGRYLLTMPDQIQILKAEETLACKVK